jgi:N-hydroxyarylamine O-acetyltransferase
VAARVDHDRRYALRNTDFAVHFPHGLTERRVLAGAGEIRQVLTDTFRINVPDWPEVDETFERLASSAPAATY